MRITSVWAALVLMTAPAAAAAQASTWISIDDPGVPVLLYLIARGDVVDPSPQVRPWRRDDVLARLAATARDSGRVAGRIAARLIDQWSPRRPVPAWSAEGRVGADDYSTGRRDLMHPAGGSGGGMVASVGAWLDAGAVSAGSRVVADSRLNHDPDWTGDAAQRAEGLPLRMVEGWISAHWRSFQVHYGQIDREWGPAGAAGLALANSEAYARPDLSLGVHRGRVDATLIVRSLAAVPDSAGQLRARAFMAHRLGFAFSATTHAALWETVVVGGPVGAWTRAASAALYPAVVARLAGSAPTDRNAILGADFSVRPNRAIGAEVQVALRQGNAIDSLTSDRTARLGVVASAFGPIREWGIWQLTYSRVPDALYTGPEIDGAALLDFRDLGAGLVRTVSGYQRMQFSVSVPLAASLLVRPGVALQSQGAAANAAAPGPAEHLREANLSIGGQFRAVQINLAVALQRVGNADNVSGATVARAEGRVTVTIGVRFNGSAQ